MNLECVFVAAINFLEHCHTYFNDADRFLSKFITHLRV